MKSSRRTGRLTPRNLSALAAATICCGLSTGHTLAGTVTNPTLVQGSGAIDPSGSQDLTANNSSTSRRIYSSSAASEATLEARSDFYVMQDWTGFSNNTLVSFTNPNTPDIRFTAANVSGVAATVSPQSNSNLATSGTNALSLGATDPTKATGTPKPATINTFTLSFGTVGAGNTFTADRSADAVSLILTNVKGGNQNGDNSSKQQFEVVFYSGNTVLYDTNTFGGYFNGTAPVMQFLNTGNGLEVYIAYSAGGDPSKQITSVQITERRDPTNGLDQVGLDDFGFTFASQAIPEPASAAMLLLPAAAMIRRKRR